MLHGRRQLVPRGVLLSQATSETYICICYRASNGERAQYGNCLGNEEEGVGHGRSVWPESPGIHARNNDRDKGMQL